MSLRATCNSYKQIDEKARSGDFGLYARAAANIRKPQTKLLSYCTFRLFARPEVCLVLLLILIQCRWCDFQFCICRSCWRGQAYCCDECRRAAKLKNHREAQRKYRQTEKGKKAHREAENRRRQGQNQKNLKNMDDTTSTPQCHWAMEILTRIKNPIWGKFMGAVCHFCGVGGQIVEAFPRRGYG